MCGVLFGFFFESTSFQGPVAKITFISMYDMPLRQKNIPLTGHFTVKKWEGNKAGLILNLQLTTSAHHPPVLTPRDLYKNVFLASQQLVTALGCCGNLQEADNCHARQIKCLEGSSQSNASQFECIESHWRKESLIRKRRSALADFSFLDRTTAPHSEG